MFISPSIDRFPRLHPAYLCCRGIHVKDAIQLVTFIASSLFAFCLISSALSSPPIKFIQNILPILPDFSAIIFLFNARSTQSHSLLLPFIFFQAIYSFAFAFFSTLCFISYWVDYSILNELFEFSPIQSTMQMKKVSTLANAFIFAFSSFISLWWTQMAIHCFHYFRDFATFKAENSGQNENAESSISRNWTNQNR